MSDTFVVPRLRGLGFPDRLKAELRTYAALEYSPYGEEYAAAGNASAIARRFTGHTWDPTAQLYYAPYRYYGPALARWTTRDPLGMVDGPNV